MMSHANGVDLTVGRKVCQRRTPQAWYPTGKQRRHQAQDDERLYPPSDPSHCRAFPCVSPTWGFADTCAQTSSVVSRKSEYT